MGPCAYPYRSVADAFVVEALTCERAILFAIDLGFWRVEIEDDSLTVINKLNSDAVDMSIISPIIHDILSHQHFFTALSFSHVLREANGIAHDMALLGR